MTDRVYSHILVPTDFHPDRKSAYRVALAAASGTGATVTLLHVAPMPGREVEGEFQGLDAIRLMHSSADSGPSPEVVRAENAELEDRLRAEVSAYQIGDVRVRYAVRRGEVEAEVRRFVRQTDVDLLVVAARQRGLLAAFARTLADRLAQERTTEVIRVTAAEDVRRESTPA